MMAPPIALIAAVVPAVFLGLLAAAPAEAKTFSTSYLTFDLPDRWNCEFRDTEFVCRSEKDPQSSREALIIVTAKEVGVADSLSDYEAHLKSPRLLPSRSGVAQPSKIYRVQQRKISDQPWVDGMHLTSELPGYYTRYLATTKEKIAILVTFSAHTSAYTKYVQDFFRSIESLRVTVTHSSLARGEDGGGGVLGVGGGAASGAFGELAPEGDATAGGGGGGGSAGGVFVGLGLVLGAVGLYLLYKRKQKPPQGRSGPPSKRT